MDISEYKVNAEHLVNDILRVWLSQNNGNNRQEMVGNVGFIIRYDEQNDTVIVESTGVDHIEPVDD